MTPAAAPQRVLVLAPTAADAEFSRSILQESSFGCCICRAPAELVHELGAGAGALLLTEETLTDACAEPLFEAISRQPAWSDIPVLMLASAGADALPAATAMERLSNVTILERPVRITTLVSALRAALRARLRQYELRDRLRALRQNEERFRLVAKAGHDSIWDSDLDSGRWLLPGGAVQPGSWQDRLHPDDRTRVMRSWQTALAGTGTFWSAEYRLRREDGSHVYVFDRGHIVRDEEGRPKRAVGAMMDITERRQAEEARALHAAIVESSDDAIISESLDGRILSWNAGAERLFGYSAAEAVGAPTMLIVPPDRIAEAVAMRERLHSGHHIDHFETVRMTRSGRGIDVLLSISPLQDRQGRMVGASLLAHDISERKRAEERLRRKSERLRLLWEAASVLLSNEVPEVMMHSLFNKIAPHFGLDACFNFMTNEAGDALVLRACIGIPGEEIENIRQLDFDQAVCGTVARRRQPMVATHIQSSDDPKVQLVKSYGIRAYACNPLIAEGRLLGTLSFASRTRDSFAADEIEFLETICHYVTVAYERLRLVDELRDADRRKDEFLATLAHELRNPLAPIRNALQIVRIARDGRAIGEAHAMMERQLSQMVRLIDDLLDVSRITQGKLELRRERVTLASVIGNAVETARPLIVQCGHALHMRLPEEEVALDADPVRLAQVFANLLNNAAKYMERGGRIWVDAEVLDGRVRVRVKDSGVGIPARALATIFDMFTQVDHSLGRAHGGLGIGLTLVRQLVGMHGGEVSAASDGAGRGSEFIVTLPVIESAKTAASTDARAPAEPVAAGEGCRILIADDNGDAASSMSQMLQLMGHQVRTVEDGQQAVLQAEVFKPQVVLLDIGMPGMDGHEAARRIRTQPWGRSMLLVALTGWGQQEDKRLAQAAGFDCHFTKPINPAALEQLLAGSVECSSSPGTAARR